MADHVTCMTSAVVLLTLVMVAVAYSRNDSIRLMNDMLENYNRKHRPVMNQSEPVIVYITVDVVSIQDFDELKGVLSLVVILYVNWEDETIGWDPDSYGGIESQTYDVKDIWYPFLIIGSSSASFKGIVDDWMAVRIYSFGLVEFSPGLLIKSICSSDVTYYPFDKQTCTVRIVTWEENDKDVVLKAPIPHSLRDFYTEHGTWSIIDNATVDDVTFGYHLNIVILRKPLYVIINTIVPIISMTLLNLIVFIIPVESGERISYTMTLLLSIAVFLTLVADSLPKTSEPMSLLSFFLVINLICSVFICLGTVWTVQIYFRKDTQEIPRWQRKLVRFMRRKKSLIEPSKQRTDDVKDIAIDKAYENDAHDENVGLCSDITWQEVAKALDKCLMLIFILIIIVSTITSMVLLTSKR